MEQLPKQITKSLAILQLAAHQLNKKTVLDAWKRNVIESIYPEIEDQLLRSNIAKDTLLRWLETDDGRQSACVHLP